MSTMCKLKYLQSLEPQKYEVLWMFYVSETQLNMGIGEESMGNINRLFTSDFLFCLYAISFVNIIFTSAWEQKKTRRAGRA